MTHLAHAPSLRQPAADGIFDYMEFLAFERKQLKAARANATSRKQKRELDCKLRDNTEENEACQREYDALLSTTEDDWRVVF